MNTSNRLQTIFRQIFDDDDLVIQDSTSASDIAEWDSLTHVSLIVAIEKEFRIRFQSAEITGLPDVGALRAVIEKKLQQ